MVHSSEESDEKYFAVIYVHTKGLNGNFTLGTDESPIDLIQVALINTINQEVLWKETKRIDEEELPGSISLAQAISEIRNKIGSKNVTLVSDGQYGLRQCVHTEASTKEIELPNYFYSFYDIRKIYPNKSLLDNHQDNNNNHSDNDQDSILDDGELFLHIFAKDMGICDENEEEEGKIDLMTNITIKLIQGEAFKGVEPEEIMMRLEPGICTKSEQVDGETVVRARGLPWQSSDQDVAKFFRGLNIAKGGVALCLSVQGRRNGEALVRFTNKEQRDLGLKRHKHHIGSRYIEVYKASGEDFINVAGGCNNEAQAFLAKGGQVIVRMRGLPYDCSPKQVVDFFEKESEDEAREEIPGEENDCKVLDGEEGVLFVKRPDGRATGDAFVLFQFENQANKALAKHKQSIGTRYIELFRSTTAEVQQVLNRCLDSSPTKPHPHQSHPHPQQQQQHSPLLLHNHGLSSSPLAQNHHSLPPQHQMLLPMLSPNSPLILSPTQNSPLPPLPPNLTSGLLTPPLHLHPHPHTHPHQHPHQMHNQSQLMHHQLHNNNLLLQLPSSQSSPSNSSSNSSGSQHVITSGTKKDCIRLRGLPYEAQVEHILEFLNEHAKNIVFQGVHMVYNAQGQPSGEAFIQMDSEESAYLSATTKHHRYMMHFKKQRYIEVFQCSGDDMNLVLTGGQSSPTNQKYPLHHAHLSLNQSVALPQLTPPQGILNRYFLQGNNNYPVLYYYPHYFNPMPTNYGPMVLPPQHHQQIPQQKDYNNINHHSIQKELFIS